MIISGRRRRISQVDDELEACEVVVILVVSTLNRAKFVFALCFGEEANIPALGDATALLDGAVAVGDVEVVLIPVVVSQ